MSVLVDNCPTNAFRPAKQKTKQKTSYIIRQWLQQYISKLISKIHDILIIYTKDMGI